MRTRSLSICASAALAAGLMGVAGGVAHAGPQECAILENTIRSQLANMTPETAPGVIASVQALRDSMAGTCDAGPTIEQLIPLPAPQTELAPEPAPSPQANPQVSCGEALEIEQGQSGPGVEALYYGLTMPNGPLGKIDDGFGIGCLITSRNPVELAQNLCYIGKNLVPMGPIYAGIAELGRVTNAPLVVEFGQSEQASWSQQCR